MRGCDSYSQFLVAIEFNARNPHVDWTPLVAPPLLLSLLMSEKVRLEQSPFKQ